MVESKTLRIVRLIEDFKEKLSKENVTNQNSYEIFDKTNGDRLVNI